MGGRESGGTDMPLSDEERLIRCAALLRYFKLSELATQARVTADVALRWLRGGGAPVEQYSRADDVGSHAPQPDRWFVTDAGRQEMRERLQMLGKHREPAPDDDQHIPRLRELLEVVSSALEAGDSTGTQDAREAARVRLRIAWEECAEQASVGYVVPYERLKCLADLENQLGLAKRLPQSFLRGVVSWLVDQIRSVSMQGRMGVHHAARIVRARSALDDRASAYLTAAAYVAQIWKTEVSWLADEEAGDVAAICQLVLQDVSLTEQLDHLLSVLSVPGNASHALEPSEREAVLLGLVRASMPERRLLSNEIVNWLLSLRCKTAWSDELAPAVVLGVIDAPHIQSGAIVAMMGDSLTRACAAQSPDEHEPETLRSIAYRLARNVLDRGGAGKGMIAETTELPRVGRYYSRTGTGRRDAIH